MIGETSHVYTYTYVDIETIKSFNSLFTGPQASFRPVNHNGRLSPAATRAQSDGVSPCRSSP